MSKLGRLVEERDKARKSLNNAIRAQDILKTASTYGKSHGQISIRIMIGEFAFPLTYTNGSYGESVVKKDGAIMLLTGAKKLIRDNIDDARQHLENCQKAVETEVKK